MPCLRETVVPALDANALICDPDGLAFLRGALGEPGLAPRLADRFGDRCGAEHALGARSVELPVAPAPDRVEPRFAEAFA